MLYVRMCMKICNYICTYIKIMHVCIYMYFCTYIYMHICMDVYTHICMYISLSECMFEINMCVFIYALMYVCL